LHRLAAHLGDEAFVPRTALLAEAGVGASIQLVPERAGFGQRLQFGAVSSGGVLLPRGNRAILLDLFESAQHRLARQVVQLFAAKIIVASFHIADAKFAVALRVNRLLDKRNVFMKELLLKILGAGRNYDALA